MIVFMCDEINEAEKKRKNRVLRQKWVAAILLILIFAVPVVVIFGRSYADWRFFTRSRIQELNRVFSIDFPQSANLERYKKVYAFQAGDIHTLYVTGVGSPEDFCRSFIGGDIRVQTDLTEETHTEYWYDGERRRVCFMCKYDIQGGTVNVYFFENDIGNYDAKFIK